MKDVRQIISSEQRVFEDNLSVNTSCVHRQQTERKSVNYGARVYICIEQICRFPVSPENDPSKSMLAESHRIK